MRKDSKHHNRGRRSLKGGVVRRSTPVATLRKLGIRQINPFRSTMTGA